MMFSFIYYIKLDLLLQKREGCFLWFGEGGCEKIFFVGLRERLRKCKEEKEFRTFIYRPNSRFPFTASLKLYNFIEILVLFFQYFFREEWYFLKQYIFWIKICSLKIISSSLTNLKITIILYFH